MRRMVIETANKAGIVILEAQLVPSAVRNAAEVFVTNALTGIRPVRRLGSQTWATGPITHRLRQLLVAAGVQECAEES
jgi:branched-subunit amino acid aminotransferase/4-amino-4-deoxychorismate lyase